LATLVTTGRAGLAASVKARNIFLGIGSGQTAWDAAGVDPENIASTALQDAIGYRKAAQVDFVTNAAQGAISLPSGRYDVSTADTNLLYCKFTLDFVDASTSTIRETGIFLDVITAGGLPSGQMFFDAASEVTGSGTLYLLEHTASIIRTPATRETFEFVLTF
jgi:hypothetical protein